ncbi:unannotated protein [freshwater metagenome]|uniref:Unannotated protein n=1 Tax=freshwater metagenome TaxID=449393 RepID=A0A6J6GJ53_9ZZZZ
MVTPFVRLSRVHALMVAGETAMAVALADSLFLSISPDAARTKVILFLAVSMAPFAVVAPFVGPVVDRMRGGHRMVVLLVGLLRAAVLIGMAFSLDSLTLFPLAFAALILSKTYAIAKSSLVPGTISGTEGLVDANSKLGQVAGITGFVVAVPSAILQLISTQATLGLGVLVFLAAALNAYRLPKVVTAAAAATSAEVEELHSSSVLSAALAMRVLRGVVGFMFFHLAFWLRREIAGTAWFGLAIALSGLATLAANFAGPHVRHRMRVEMMLLAALIAVSIAGIGAAWYDRVVGGILLAALVNAAAALGRLAFEATVQSGAPDANRGRAFARFETQNQMAWVIGGIIPVIFSPAGWLGFAIVGFVGIAGTITFVRMGGITFRSRAVRARDRERRSHSE